jgi:hypothetical protein
MSDDNAPIPGGTPLVGCISEHMNKGVVAFGFEALDDM